MSKMRRWNGWGDDGVVVGLADRLHQALIDALGPGARAPDASLEYVLGGLPPSAVELSGAELDPLMRLTHARGQSFPDWIALRTGRIGRVPDAVAFPESEAAVEHWLKVAREQGVSVIPYGGGTSVVGHLTPPSDDPAPILTLDLARLTRLLDLDETNLLATFLAGVRGPDLEDALGAAGYRLGHFPQSFEYSTLGGWIATRSCGQESHGYGRIEDLFAGGRVITPRATLELPAMPASAAGPDLRQLVLGSEGRMGVITRATVRIQPLPEREVFHGVLFKEWHTALEAVRTMAQSELPLAMIRLSDPVETQHGFAMGESRALRLTLGALGRAGYGSRSCLMIMAASGSLFSVRLALGRAYAIARQHSGMPLGPAPGQSWKKQRFRAPYLRNTLWDHGYAVDTMETAVRWSELSAACASVRSAAEEALLEFDERVVCLIHLSHFYRDGASIYVTCLFRRTADPDELLVRWQALKRAVSHAIVQSGGTISHQHGVGSDHAPYLEHEKSALGMSLLRASFAAADPDRLMNPGKLA